MFMDFIDNPDFRVEAGAAGDRGMPAEEGGAGHEEDDAEDLTHYINIINIINITNIII